MDNTSSTNITFDRLSGKVSAPNFLSHTHVRAMQASTRILAPFGHVGISRVHAAIGRLFGVKNDTCISENSFRFTYPSGDYYWNRLLSQGWNYEPEIDFFLKSFSQVPFAFLDLGANFGFWSARVGGGLYGEHLSIAVEPSDFAFGYLQRNSQGLKNEVRARRFAIDETFGQKINLYGSRHAGLSINDMWPGANKTANSQVESISIDKLVDVEKISLAKTPLVIKLDVEGAELRAIKGATGVLNANSVFIIEDAEKNGVSDAISTLYNELGCTVYMMHDEKLTKINSLDAIVAHKRATSTLQWLGLNLVVTKSLQWTKIIDGIEAS